MENYYHWLTLSEQYLKTSRLIMEQIRSHKNKWFMIDDKPIEWNDYFEATKWSDFDTFVPSLFLMQHGLELLLKGLSIWSGVEVKKTHNVACIIQKLKTDSRIDKNLLELLDLYTGENPKSRIMRKFMKVNEHIRIDRLHIELRYPESSGHETDFSAFRYKETKLLNELNTIISDIDSIIKITLEIIRGSTSHNTSVTET